MVLLNESMALLNTSMAYIINKVVFVNLGCCSIVQCFFNKSRVLRSKSMVLLNETMALLSKSMVH